MTRMASRQSGSCWWGWARLTLPEVRKAAGVAVRFAKPRKLREVTIAIPEGLDPAAAARALVEGAYIGDFDPDTYRSDRKDQSIEQLNIVGAGSAVEAGAARGGHSGRGAELYPQPGQ